MKTLQGFTVATLLACLLFAQASQATPSDDEQALRHLKEVAWPQAYREQDTALLDSILADEFQMISGSGDWSTKLDELRWIRSNKPDYDAFSFEIRRLEIFENGTAIVAGTGTIHATDNDGPYLAEYQSTNVLIKRDGVWRAIASHVSGYRRK